MTSWKLLDGVPEEAQRAVIALAVGRSWQKGEVLFRAGDLAETVHFIQSGRYAVQVRTSRGDTRMLAILGPGDIFGEIALVSEQARRSADVVSLESGRTHALLAADFRRLRRENPSVTEVLVALLAGQVRRLTQQVMDLNYTPAHERVIACVAALAEGYGDGSEKTLIPLTQEQIGQLAGTSRQVASEALAAEARRGRIEIGRGRIMLLAETDPAQPL